MKYVDVVIDNKTRMTDTFYTYECDDDTVEIGRKVYVPFARSRNPREAYVVSVSDENEKGITLKKVISLDDDICLNEEMINTAIWMKKRYLVRYIDGITCFTPKGDRPARKIKKDHEIIASEEPKVMTAEQKAAVEKILPALKEKRHEIFLLHGVTSSGKTEVYMQIIKSVIESGRTAVMMVPEIALTGQVIERFEKRFGSDSIAVMHSGLTKAQRYVQWQKIRSGEVSIVIGARSACFAPLSNIGVFILDEEHESTYKSDMTPKYETVEVAVKRAKSSGASIILGSATPSAVSYERALSGIYTLVEMKKRYNENKMPEVTVVDMKDELRNGNLSHFSNTLYLEMKDCLEKGQQVILFLNRRGYSTYISCNECGYVFKCPSCGISMTYHKDINGLSCHYCGKTMAMPKVCPDCGGKITMGGLGTQKLEEEIASLFPGFSVERLDFDSTKRVGSLKKILGDFSKGKTDILIGTQMVAKGLDFANVGLVGITAADNSLNIPDFRACERTYQLITQASGRTGRGENRGKVIIQTFDPDHYAVKCAASNDYKSFVEMELKMRKMMNYPPYSDIIRLLFTGKDEKNVSETAWEFYSSISSVEGISEVFIPSPAQVSKIDDMYRYSILMKCPKGKRGLYTGAVNYYLNEMMAKNSKVNMIVDINPYSFV